jgi:hypothetical protein
LAQTHTGTAVFTYVTKANGITIAHVYSPDKKFIVESMSGGVAIFDFDKDGWQDVYLVNSPSVAMAAAGASARSELWRNRGDGTFTDVTDAAGVGRPGWGMGVVAADVDNDGWEDLYVTCFGPNRLYRTPPGSAWRAPCRFPLGAFRRRSARYCLRRRARSKKSWRNALSN